MNRPVTLAVLMVCRNRRATTLRALHSLSRASGAMRLKVVLFDDASTDGTVEAVLEGFPDTVIVRGDGNAFWNGGLYQAWLRALDLAVDGFLWLNDDVELDGDALDRLADAWERLAARQGNHRFILVGSTRDSQGRLTYGGDRLEHSPFALRLRIVEPDEDLKPIDTFNGNFVAIPRQVVDEIGINDPCYFHNFGDNDYGLRASRAGISVRLLEGTVGVCDLNYAKLERGFGSNELSLRQQWAKVNTHHGLPFRSWWRFTRRFSGPWFPLHFLIPYRSLIAPRIVRRSRAKRSVR